MKWIAIISVLFFLTSCEKDEEKTKILSANVNGKEIQFIGNAYRYNDLRNDKAFGYNYHLFNLQTPNIYIEAYDSSFVKTQFDFSNLKAKYAYNDSKGNSKSYDAINGDMSITKEENGVLFGNFRFIFINILDVTDTITVRDGYFEITLQKHDRVWYD
jgi:hypothetical protein